MDLDVGDGKLSEPNDGYALIEIPEQFLITNYDNLIHVVVKSDKRDYLSSDSIDRSESNDIEALQGFTTKFLNSLRTSGLPNHKIKLKVGTSIMLLRNLYQTEGLCNGTIMIVNRLATHVIEAKVMTGKNKFVYWEDILHSTNEFVSIPFTVTFQINKETISVDCFICYDN
ncbi:hypothetical protein Lal_00021444 [Lupinus albus]|nr:hypothetical protein Lal_00021444 [Lupinus albus]